MPPIDVLVAYDSRRGTTRSVAERIGLVAQGSTPNVRVEHVRAIPPAEVVGFDVVFLGAWVSGLVVVGVGPSEPAVRWAKALPDVSGTIAGVFCTYDVNPRRTLDRLGELLADRGALVVAGNASRRRNPLAGVDAFTRRVLGAARERHPRRPAARPAPR
jgi:hypothetical protein